MRVFDKADVDEASARHIAETLDSKQELLAFLICKANCFAEFPEFERQLLSVARRNVATYEMNKSKETLKSPANDDLRRLLGEVIAAQIQHEKHLKDAEEAIYKHLSGNIITHGDDGQRSF